MRLVVERVTRAAVRRGETTIAEIDRGALVLCGIADGDTPEVADEMADKLVTLRLFQDAEGHTNLDIGQVGGRYLVVSQFTLLATLRHGRRPGFSHAAAAAIAEPLVDRFVARLQTHGVPVATGQFGAAMQVESVNDGPFTLVLDSRHDLRPAS